MEEIYKSIKRFEKRYAISNYGNVKNLKTGKILKSQLRKDGYFQIGLEIKDKKIMFLIHRLMAIAFISNPLDKKFINHINGIKADNRLENLEWVTHKENMQHAHKTGLNPARKGVKHHGAKLDNEDIKLIRFLKDKVTKSDLGYCFDVTRQQVHHITSYNQWRHI